MPTSSTRAAAIRLSLRELLLLVALVGLAMVSLKHASDVWIAVVMAIAMFTFIAVLVVAAVDRGPRQVFSIGFALAMISYYALLHTGNRDEFNPYKGRLPTTWLLRHAHQAVDSGSYYDMTTGAEVPNYDPAQDPNRRLAGAGGFMAPGTTLVTYREKPSRDDFMVVGHCWWALVLGFLGGIFARYVYWRRLREEQPLAVESS